MAERIQIFESGRTHVPSLAGFIDVYIEEEHLMEVDVTQYPVESRAEISDHATIKPIKIRLNGGQSDLRRNGASEDARLAHAGAGWRAITALLQNRELHVIETPLRRYENMVLTRAKSVVNNSVGRTLRVELEFTEVLTAATVDIQFRERGDIAAEPVPI